MRYLRILCLIVAATICQTSSGAEKDSPKAKQGDARVQQKSVAARPMRGLVQGTKAAVPVLLLRVETRPENGKQKIVATATAHSGAQTGPLTAVDSLVVRVTQPAQFRKEGRRTNTAVATGSAESGGALKAVTADAVMVAQGFEEARIVVKVPGG
jgi:hypothetical protein